MTISNPLNESEEERVAQFIDLFRKLVFQVTAHKPEDVDEVIRELKGLIDVDGSRQIAGPIAFYSMSKSIYEKPTITMGELAKQCQTSPATASRLVAWWVDNGLAERLSDPNDKRIVRVRITEDGKRLHEINRGIAVRRTGSFLSPLTTEEQVIFNSLLEKITSRWEEPD